MQCDRLKVISFVPRDLASKFVGIDPLIQENLKLKEWNFRMGFTYFKSEPPTSDRSLSPITIYMIFLNFTFIQVDYTMNSMIIFHQMVNLWMSNS